jgi:hypothetical protein
MLLLLLFVYKNKIHIKQVQQKAIGPVPVIILWRVTFAPNSLKNKVTQP